MSFLYGQGAARDLGLRKAVDASRMEQSRDIDDREAKSKASLEELKAHRSEVEAQRVKDQADSKAYFKNVLAEQFEKAMAGLKTERMAERTEDKAEVKKAVATQSRLIQDSVSLGRGELKDFHGVVLGNIETNVIAGRRQVVASQKEAESQGFKARRAEAGQQIAEAARLLAEGELADVQEDLADVEENLANAEKDLATKNQTEVSHCSLLCPQ
jgi:hypothetical protein